jgi:SAM-dependent MidA family methyltransferase
LKQLTLPTEMGELFKVIGLIRDITSRLCGFQLQDRRARL